MPGIHCQVVPKRSTEQEMYDELETNFFGTVRVALNAIQVMRQAEYIAGV
jgi:hypothetical protein